MSKKANDGDVLANMFALANSQKRLASLLGPEPESHASTTIVSKPEIEDKDLKRDFTDPERLGFGGIRPKDIEDGSFTKRTHTSDHKLLAQLIGNKRAKVHIAAKQQAERFGTQPQPKNGRGTTVKKDESDDEEEGRAVIFKSKRRRTNRPAPNAVEDEEKKEDETSAPQEEGAEKKEPIVIPIQDGVNDQPASKKLSKQIPSRSKAKPTSYLDELLDERSKKKKSKNATKIGADR
ncbi:hypothetical protein GQ44DRAFT_183149 [Phaeosphaeriaceae sp. PMI808]|nr:hypothetical protein GQ44DRAFT_183149 [Phaeosphaeriaceae sp. PMI808]